MVRRMLGDRERSGRMDMEASEQSIRASMHEIGGRLLEKLLNGDKGGYRGWRIECGQGHRAKFVGYRWKEVITVLAPVRLERAYYHCDECRSGVIPKDEELDLLGTSLSPGVRRMIGRVGAKESFDEGRQDMKELAGIVVKTKEVERVSEAIGAEVEGAMRREREAILSGKVLSLQSAPKLYVAVDGTTVPMVGRETEGRRGRDETGKAKTREAKVGCVFTQTGLDDRGRPLRDEESTSYVGAIETAETFGLRIYAEAIRRGAGRADRVIVLGDGAQWIWALAEMHFPEAVEIVDLYHAREHLADVAKAVYGVGTRQAKRWLAARTDQLDRGGARAVLASLKWLRPRANDARESVDTAVDYFRRNAHRMNYPKFRKDGLFVGSGVVEAACKTLVGQRLKQSGMRWTVKGANAILALRCCQKSGRWEEFWDARAAS